MTIGRASILSDPTGHRDWYVGSRKDGRRFFRRYLQFLSQELGWSPSTTEALDESTDTVMELLEDPRREAPWDRRGLVVGHVQSGKTANYAGLIAKAADAGYLLIVVLAGMHNALRGQTQARLDRDFLGYDTARVRRDQQPAPLGVGAIDASCHAEYLTTKLSDFKRSIANVGTGVQQRPLLLVIKKNASILRNVNSWVEEILVPRGDAGRSPLLVIDDEADQASVDTGDPELDDAGVAPDDYSPTRINGEIRRLLGCFERSAYVGYTARRAARRRGGRGWRIASLLGRPASRRDGTDWAARRRSACTASSSALGWLAAHVGFPAALEGWRGPFHGMHDFVLERRAFEVKTATGDDRRMRIGSLDQLEEQGLPLAVLRPRLEAARAGRTLAELVGDTRGEVAASAPSSSRLLEELLMRCGYLDLDAESYAERLELASLCGYRVDGALPRLRRSEIDPAITEAEYQIDEGRLSGLRIEAPGLAALLGKKPDGR